MARVTRQTTKIDLTVRLKGAEEFNREIAQILSKFKSREDRRQIAEAAKQLVIDSARAQVYSRAVSDEVHYTYNTPKLVRRLKAPPGQGVKVGEYTPGNLARSIIDIAERRRKYAKNNSKVIIGPYYRGRGPLSGKSRAIFNSLSRIDGFYAHMIYGSAQAFQSRIMIPALTRVQSQVVAKMRAKAQEMMQAEAAKTSIQFVKG